MPTRRATARPDLAVLLAAILPATLACAHARDAVPARYDIDPVHTRVLFSLDHAGYSRALGTVSGSTGTITFAPGDWTHAHVDVSVPLGRLELGDDAWNRAALGMLDAGRHPVARFVSTRVEPIGDWTARVCGDLSLHGATRELCLDVAFNQLARYPLPPFHRVVGFSASGHLERSDFGIDSWTSLVGGTVELRIEVEARHAGPARAARERQS